MQKILIVEDDIDIQDILKNHLIDAGYEVAVASDGVAGIAMFDDTIDLLLLDIMLPKIDGYPPQPPWIQRTKTGPWNLRHSSAEKVPRQPSCSAKSNSSPCRCSR